MGDRVSIRFVNIGNGGYDAPVIFCHWGGLGFVEAAVKYSQDLIAERSGSLDPLDRLEPSTVTCDFLYNLDRYYPIMSISSKNPHRITHDIYIGKDENDGDNGDNGHFNIELNSIDKLNTMIADIASGYADSDHYWG